MARWGPSTSRAVLVATATVVPVVLVVASLGFLLNELLVEVRPALPALILQFAGVLLPQGLWLGVLWTLAARLRIERSKLRLAAVWLWALSWWLPALGLALALAGAQSFVQRTAGTAVHPLDSLAAWHAAAGILVCSFATAALLHKATGSRAVGRATLAASGLVACWVLILLVIAAVQMVREHAALGLVVLASTLGVLIAWWTLVARALLDWCHGGIARDHAESLHDDHARPGRTTARTPPQTRVSSPTNGAPP
jgi:hypothetical protein